MRLGYLTDEASAVPGVVSGQVLRLPSMAFLRARAKGFADMPDDWLAAYAVARRELSRAGLRSKLRGLKN